MVEKAKKCSHPQMCPDKDLFQEKIKTQKLALESPPASELVKPK